MNAIVWQRPNEMTVEERPDPADPGPGELILRPEAVDICGSVPAADARVLPDGVPVAGVRADVTSLHVGSG